MNLIVKHKKTLEYGSESWFIRGINESGALYGEVTCTEEGNTLVQNIEAQFDADDLTKFKKLVEQFKAVCTDPKQKATTWTTLLAEGPVATPQVLATFGPENKDDPSAMIAAEIIELLEGYVKLAN